jgi:hypothetical protein
MKLTEKQGFKLINWINETWDLEMEEQEKSDLVMLELINLEL